MVRSFSLHIPIYASDILFILGQSDTQARKSIEKCCIGIDIDDYLSHKLNLGRCTAFVNGWQIIRIGNYPETPFDYNTLQHEIFHAVINIMYRVGMEYDHDKNDEAYAYLIGYITEQVYDKIW